MNSAGDVFVADTGKSADHRRSCPTAPPRPSAPGSADPIGVAVDSAGDLFVADYANQLVKEVLPDGTIKTIGSGVQNPNGVAVDAAGDLFVADSLNPVSWSYHPRRSPPCRRRSAARPPRRSRARSPG